VAYMSKPLVPMPLGEAAQLLPPSGSAPSGCPGIDADGDGLCDFEGDPGDTFVRRFEEPGDCIVEAKVFDCAGTELASNVLWGTVVRVNALGPVASEIGCPREHDGFLLGAADEREPKARGAVIWELAGLAAEEADHCRPPENHIERIKQLASRPLRDRGEEAPVLVAAARAAAKLELAGALPELRARAQDVAAADELRIACIAALGELKDAQSRDLLRALSESGDHDLRRSAAFALKRVA
jgi:hypothetical protein